MNCTHANGCCARHPRACEVSPDVACVWYHRNVTSYTCAGWAVDRRIAPISRSADSSQLDFSLFGRNVYFVGDSMSMQHFHAFACHVGADIPTAPLDIMQPFEGSTCAATRSRPAERVCHVRAGGNASWTSGRACAQLAPLIRRGDIVIANEGLWHRGQGRSGEVEEEVRLVRELGLGLAALHAKGAALLWRETTAQHFSTLSGQYHKPAGCQGKACGTKCQAVRNEFVQRAINTLVNRALEAMSVPVLPVFESSLRMWADHVEHRGTSPLRKSTALDCTHFCEPSPLFASTDLTLRILSAS